MEFTDENTGEHTQPMNELLNVYIKLFICFEIMFIYVHLHMEFSWGYASWFVSIVVRWFRFIFFQFLSSTHILSPERWLPLCRYLHVYMGIRWISQLLGHIQLKLSRWCTELHNCVNKTFQNVQMADAATFENI